MSFEDQTILRTTVKCAESPGDNSTLIDALVSEDCSMSPILSDECSMKAEVFDMPLLDDYSTNNSESNYPSDEYDKEFSTKNMTDEGYRIELTNSVVSPIAQDYQQSLVGIESLHSNTEVFSNDVLLINNNVCQTESMDISEYCKCNTDEHEDPFNVSTEKLAGDYRCTVHNDYSISEFLVFREAQAPTDTKLKYGCFVQLERINVSAGRPTRNTKPIDRYCTSPLRLKQSRTTVASNCVRKQKRSGKRYKAVYKEDTSPSDNSPNQFNEQRKIILRFVRPKPSSSYKCFQVSGNSQEKIDHKRESRPMNAKQPVQRDLRSGKRITLPELKADRSDRSKDRNSKNVKQSIQLHSIIDKQMILPESKAPRRDRSKDQSHAKRKRDVSRPNVKQTPKLHFVGHERTMLNDSKVERSDRSMHQRHERTMLKESKVDRSDRSKHQGRTKQNVHPKNVKHPVQSHSSGYQRITLPETKARRLHQIKDQSDTDESDTDQSDTDQSDNDRNVCPTYVKQSLKLHSSDDKRTILSESKADNSFNSKRNCNEMDEFVETNVVKTNSQRNGMSENDSISPQLESHISNQPLDLTISKNKNLNKSQDEFTVMERNIVKAVSPIRDTINDNSTFKNVKKNLRELFGTSSESLSSDTDDENSTSFINIPQRSLPTLNTIDKTIVASKYSDDESSVSSELSIFAPSLSELTDSPTAKSSPPRIVNCQNNNFDLKKFRIPKTKRNPAESEKQQEDERPNTKSQTRHTFGNGRNPAESEKQREDEQPNTKSQTRHTFGNGRNPAKSEKQREDERPNTKSQTRVTFDNGRNPAKSEKQREDERPNTKSQTRVTFDNGINPAKSEKQREHERPNTKSQTRDTFGNGRNPAKSEKQREDERPNTKSQTRHTFGNGRNLAESEKQREDERPNTKWQTRHTFGNGRDRNNRKTKTQKKLPVKKTTNNTSTAYRTRSGNTSSDDRKYFGPTPKRMKSTANLNETVEQKKAENTTITWKLIAPEELLAVGGSIHALVDDPKHKNSRDSEKSEILQPQNFINDVTRTTNCNDLPQEDIFRTCLGDSKSRSNPLSSVSQSCRGKINVLENYQIQVPRETSAIRNVRYVPNDNGRQLINYGEVSDLLMTNQSSEPLDLFMSGPTEQPLPLFPMMKKSIPQLLPRMYDPMMYEQSIQNQELKSLLTVDTSNISSEFDSIEKRRLWRSKITKMFDGPCIAFLANQCDGNCRYRHTLPSIDNIEKKLNCQGDEFIQFTYTDFFSKNFLTFEMYFPLICQLYGQRKLRASFDHLIMDCEKFGKEEYLKFVFDGLMQCDLHKRDALLIIVDKCQISSASDNIILQIIETDPQCFIDVLKMFASRIKLSSSLVTKLLQQVTDNPEPGILSNCTDLLEKIGETMLDIDVLNTFCANIFAVGNDTLSQKILNVISKLLQLKTI